MLKILKLKVEQGVFFSGDLGAFFSSAGGAEQASAQQRARRSVGRKALRGAHAVAPRRSERWGACGREAWRGGACDDFAVDRAWGTGRGGGGAARGEGSARADGSGWGIEKVRKERGI